MSSFEASARLILGSPLKSLEFSVVDAEFREVAHGIGALDVNVLPGIYELRFQAGPQREKRLVSVAPGQIYQDTEIKVAFPSAAPIMGTSTSHEHQQAAAAEASQTTTAAGVGAAGLVLMVRNVRDSHHLVCDEATVAALELRDSELAPVPEFASGWQLDSGSGWATWSANLAPGGYALRVRRPPGRSEQEPVVFDQSVWLANGWQTLVFIPNGPHGPVPEAASVHMAELALEWSPGERVVSSALELALWGLREGRGVLPMDLRPLLEGKFQNPMLGIIAAHSLLLHPEPDFELLGTVLGNLAGLVPDHPDLTALLWLEAEKRSESRYPDDAQAPPATLVGWPPLLHASYTALIRRDAHDESTIPDGSVAERAAAQLLSGGVWTSWEPLEDPVPGGAQDESQLPVTPDAMRRAPIANKATQRVARYLADVAEVRQRSLLEILRDMAPGQIGVAAGLPSASVKRAVDEILERTNT
jgi:hypothetical protein